MTKSMYSERHIKIRAMLLEERQNSGLSQEALAEKLGVNQTYVSKYEIGERRLDIEEFLDIAEALNFDPANFIKKLHKTN